MPKPRFIIPILLLVVLGFIYLLSATEKSGTNQKNNTIKRMVIAGDSWSGKMVAPMRRILQKRGYSVKITSGTTTVYGSRAYEWAKNQDNKMTRLHSALDETPKAELMLLVIGINDINHQILYNHYHRMPRAKQSRIMGQIISDIKQTVSEVLAKRPHLQVVIIGYDFLHWKAMSRFNVIKDLEYEAYNRIVVELERRKLALAMSVSRLEYAHNLGVMQYEFGDKPTSLFKVPQKEYLPHHFPKPGYAPSYEPFPGGFDKFPSPHRYIKDGIHPHYKGFMAILKNSFDQGLENLVKGKDWTD